MTYFRRASESLSCTGHFLNSFITSSFRLPQCRIWGQSVLSPVRMQQLQWDLQSGSPSPTGLRFVSFKRSPIPAPGKTEPRGGKTIPVMLSLKQSYMALGPPAHFTVQGRSQTFVLGECAIFCLCGIECLPFVGALFLAMVEHLCLSEMVLAASDRKLEQQ